MSALQQPYAALGSREKKIPGVPWMALLSVAGLLALVTGASPSVMRSATMFSFLIIGRRYFRYTNIYNILAASALFCSLRSLRLTPADTCGEARTR